MRNVIFAIVFISPPFLKKCILRWFCGAKIGRGVRIGWFSSVIGKHIEMGDYSEICPLTLIRCDGEVKIGADTEISSFTLIYGFASLIVGDHCHIALLSLINVVEDVRIGNRSGIGPRCTIFTHGSFFPYTKGYWVKFAGVTIGDNVWIGAEVFIHPGVKIDNNVLVNARAVLTQDVPAGRVVEGFPARGVAQLEKIRRIMTAERVDAAVCEILRRFAKLVLRRRMGIEVKEDTVNQFNFYYRGRRYFVLCIPSEGPIPSMNDPDRRKCLIFVVNRRNWTPPPTLRNPMVFDLTTMRANFSRDKVYKELYRFMKKDYGVIFEYHQ